MELLKNSILQAFLHSVSGSRGRDADEHALPHPPKTRQRHGENVMTLLRRQFLQLAGSAVALPIASQLARAQNYPVRPVRIVVSYPAGNASDIIGRVVAQALSERLGQQFIIENRPGVSGT